MRAAAHSAEVKSGPAHAVIILVALMRMLIDGSCGLTELELILASDVFIACGKRGCDAQSLACAMAGRCGIVACGGAGGTEFLRDGDTCLTVNRAIPRLIAAAMLKLWEEPKLRERLGQNARAKA